MLDAPVSGHRRYFGRYPDLHCRGAAQDLEEARPYLRPWVNVFSCGEHGASQSAKICNNMLLAILHDRYG